MVERMRYLWWLVFCDLTGLRYVWIAGKTLFLGVSVRVFSKETSIWVGRLCKEDIPSLMWQSNLIQWGPKYHKKVEEGQTFLFSSVLGHHFFCSWTSELLVLRSLHSGTYTRSPRFSQDFVLRLNCSTGFSGSAACRWHIVAYFSLPNCMSQFL